SKPHASKIWPWPYAKQEADFDAGIASVGNALGDPAAVAPFFRFPGLGRSNELESYFAGKGIMILSADFPADDWTRISSRQIAACAIARRAYKGTGVRPLHDIHRTTVAATPLIFAERKQRGSSVVPVVAAGPGEPKTETEPSQWLPPTPPAKPAVAKPAVARHAVPRPAVSAV